jgi:chromate transporter
VFQALQKSFTPISIGLLAATAWIFTRVSNTDWRADLLTVLATLAVLNTRLNPVVLIAIGAAAGLAQLV